jgi:2,4-dienoyl-CoA reductase-like NADH-dependent reductase (Old Yellow Enzyme family)
LIDLFQPYRIGKLELSNRFVRSATWDATANSDGTVSDASLALFKKLGSGGIGLIVTGHTFMAPNGQAGFGQYGIHNDKMVLELRQLVAAVHRSGGKIAIQITHAGINAMRAVPNALVVSQMPTVGREQHEMSEDDIEVLLDDFVKAAVRAREAGFDAVQFHGAHGYLLNQFISPVINRRTDRWGGSIENRSRFHVEVIRRSRQAVGHDFPLLIKFGIPGKSGKGLTVEDSLWTAAQMCEAGIDAIEVSADSSAMERNAVPLMKRGEPERVFFRDRAAAVKGIVNVPVILVGGIRSLATASDIVNSGDADLIAMSRPFICEPALLKRWQENSNRTVDCISCNRCFPFGVPEGSVVMCRKRPSSEV